MLRYGTACVRYEGPSHKAMAGHSGLRPLCPIAGRVMEDLGSGWCPCALYEPTQRVSPVRQAEPEFHEPLIGQDAIGRPWGWTFHLVARDGDDGCRQAHT